MADELGLPSRTGNTAAPANILAPPPAPTVDGTRFVLPENLLETAAAKRYGLTREKLAFTLIEPTPAIEKACAKFAQSDNAKLGQRLLDSCLLEIGDERVNMNQKMLDDWFRMIGNRGRKIVSQIFIDDFMSVSVDELEAVKASGEPVTR